MGDGLNIFYSTAVNAQTQYSKEIGRSTIEILEKHGRVLTKHLVIEDLIVLDRVKEANGENLCDRDLECLNESDVFVMDSTLPMTGGGFEFIYATHILGIPSLVVSHKYSRMTPMIRQFRHPQVSFGTYEDSPDLEKTIDDYFSKIKARHTLHPKFVMCDAMDGAGKGAIIEALSSWAREKGLRTFDAVEYWKREDRMPLWEEVDKIAGGCQMLFVAEPTYTGIGKQIRGEIIRKDNTKPYSALSTAHVFSLDREVLYKRLVTDALNAGIFVASDRGVVTSEHYQPIQAELMEGYSRHFFLGTVRGLPGNRLVLRHAPGLLILPHVSAEGAQDRLSNRTGKKDNSRFEQNIFRGEFAKAYAGGSIRRSYERRGTKVCDIDTEACKSKEGTMHKAREIWESYLSENHISV